MNNKIGGKHTFASQTVIVFFTFFIDKCWIVYLFRPLKTIQMKQSQNSGGGGQVGIASF